MRRLLFLSILLLLAMPLAAMESDSKGTLIGRVSDTSGAVLQGAQILIQPSMTTSVSSIQGEFILTNLAPGSYNVSITFVGFAPFTKSVTILAGQTTSLDAVMEVASSAQEIIVTATDVHGDAEAINRIASSENILNVITNDQIMSLPNADVADALGRLMGVTLERDEGEGKYVQIRGTEPRLSNTTINGVLVPSPESTVNQIKLDTIPADLVESVEINKTLSANQDGDAIGGSVNLVTKTAGDRPTLTAFGEGGYTPIIDGRHASQYGITAGKRYHGKKLGILGNFTYDYNGRGIDDIEPTPDPGTLTPSYDSIDLREYRYDRSRWGAATSIDYKLSEGSLLFAKVFYSDFKDFGDKWTYTLNDQVTPNPNDPSGDPATFTGDKPKFKTSRRAPDYAIGSLAVGGNHLFTNSWFKWEAAVSRARQLAAAGNPGATFSASKALKNFAGDNCFYDPGANPSQFRPQWNPACTAAGSPLYDPTQWSLTELDLTSGQTMQINLQGSAAYAINYKAGGHFSTLEFGAKVRNQHKGQDAYSPVYDNEADGILMSQFLNPLTNSNYYDNSYKMGPLTEWGSIVNYANANPGQIGALDEGATHLGSDASNFNLEERITAGYIMNTAQFGKLHLQAGVRFEQTDLKTTGYQVITESDGSWNPGDTTPVNGSKSYLDVLPSVQAKYSLDQNSDIRASYGRGIARPDPQDLIPYITLDTSQNPAQKGIGNPLLIPEHANNVDLLYERYLNPLGLVQAGFFYKALTNPLTSTITPVNDPTYGPTIITQPNNGGSAWVYGIELGYQQRLSFLPGVLGGLGFNGNYTYSNSRAKGVDPLRTDNPALLRQTPNTWNVGPSYDRGRFSVHMGLEYNGASIYSYQYRNLQANPDGSTSPNPQVGGVAGPAGDNYLYAHLQVDAQASFRLSKGFEVYAQGLNLNNEVFGFYYGSPQYVVQREYYHPTYGGGLRWTSGTKK
ncbi:MAG: TonB-dependent receptor [Terracidiphilus sp.]